MILSDNTEKMRCKSIAGCLKVIYVYMCKKHILKTVLILFKIYQFLLYGNYR